MNVWEWTPTPSFPCMPLPQDFRSWARVESFSEQRLPTINHFVQRLKARPSYMANNVAEQRYLVTTAVPVKAVLSLARPLPTAAQGSISPGSHIFPPDRASPLFSPGNRIDPFHEPLSTLFH
jgi:hypothetical protein